MDSTLKEIKFVTPKNKQFFITKFLFLLGPPSYIKIYSKMPCKQKSLSTGVLLGNLEGICLLGLFWKQRTLYLSSFFWTQRTLKILSLGAIWNFDKGTGISWADIRLWGTKGLYIRPRCIGTVRARIHHNSINQSINTDVLINVVQSATAEWLNHKQLNSHYAIPILIEC
jgi:hypothetical protein